MHARADPHQHLRSRRGRIVARLHRADDRDQPGKGVLHDAGEPWRLRARGLHGGQAGPRQTVSSGQLNRTPIGELAGTRALRANLEDAPLAKAHVLWQNDVTVITALSTPSLDPNFGRRTSG